MPSGKSRPDNYVAGIGLGGVAAFWMTRGLCHFLFEVRPADPLTLTAVPVVLLAAAVLAAWLPARRAQRIDAVEAIRQDQRRSCRRESRNPHVSAPRPTR